MNGNRQNTTSTSQSGARAAGERAGSVGSPFGALQALAALTTAESDGPAARIADLGRGIGRAVRSQPVEVALAALGIGFAIGGALSFRGGRLALGLAARHLGRELLKQVL